MLAYPKRIAQEPHTQMPAMNINLAPILEI